MREKVTSKTFNLLAYCDVRTDLNNYELNLYILNQDLNGCYCLLTYTLERVIRRFSTEEISFLLDVAFTSVFNQYASAGDYHGLLFRSIEERIQFNKEESNLGAEILIKLKDLSSLEELTLFNFIEQFWFGNVCPSLQESVNYYFSSI